MMTAASCEVNIFSSGLLRALAGDDAPHKDEIQEAHADAPAQEVQPQAAQAEAIGEPPAEERVSFRLWLAANVVTTVVFLLMIVGFVTFALYIATVNDMAYSIWTSRSEAAAARFAAFTSARAAEPDAGAVSEFIAAERASAGIDDAYRITIVSPGGEPYSLPDQPEISGAVSFTAAVPLGGIVPPAPEEGAEPSGWRLVIETAEEGISAPVRVVSGSLFRVNIVAIIFASMAAYLIGTRMSYRIRAIIDNVIRLKRAESSEEI